MTPFLFAFFPFETLKEWRIQDEMQGIGCDEMRWDEMVTDGTFLVNLNSTGWKIVVLSHLAIGREQYNSNAF